MPDAKTLSRLIGNSVESSPALWRLVQQYRYRDSAEIRKFVTPSHHVTLEGFPRSGNSFAVRAFLFANGRDRNWAVATHAHRLAQVRLSLQYGLPTSIFIREPRAALTSLVALSLSDRVNKPAEVLQFLRERLEYYTHYHTAIAEMQNELVISSFATTTGSFGKVVEAMNVKFGTDFKVFSDSAEDVAQIFATSRKHLSPNSERDQIKAQVAEIYDSEALAGSRLSAEHAFARLEQFAL